MRWLLVLLLAGCGSDRPADAGMDAPTPDAGASIACVEGTPGVWLADCPDYHRPTCGTAATRWEIDVAGDCVIVSFGTGCLADGTLEPCEPGYEHICFPPDDDVKGRSCPEAP